MIYCVFKLAGETQCCCCTAINDPKKDGDTNPYSFCNFSINLRVSGAVFLSRPVPTLFHAVPSHSVKFGDVVATEPLNRMEPELRQRPRVAGKMMTSCPEDQPLPGQQPGRLAC